MACQGRYSFLYFAIVLSTLLQPCPAPALITVPASEFSKTLASFSDGAQALSDLLGLPPLDTGVTLPPQNAQNNYGIKNPQLAAQVRQIKDALAQHQQVAGGKPFAPQLPAGFLEPLGLSSSLVQNPPPPPKPIQAPVPDVNTPVLDLATPYPEDRSAVGNLRTNQIPVWQHQNRQIGGLPTSQQTNPIAYDYWGNNQPGIIPRQGIPQAPIRKPIRAQNSAVGGLPHQTPYYPQQYPAYIPATIPPNGIPQAPVKPQWNQPSASRYPQHNGAPFAAGGTPNFKGFSVQNSNGQGVAVTVTRPPTTTPVPTTTTTTTIATTTTQPPNTLVLDKQDVLQLVQILERLTPEELGTEQGAEIKTLAEIAKRVQGGGNLGSWEKEVIDRQDNYDWAGDTKESWEAINEEDSDDGVPSDYLQDDEPERPASDNLKKAQPSTTTISPPTTSTIVSVENTTLSEEARNKKKEKVSAQLRQQLFRASKEFERVTLPIRAASQQDLVSLAQATGIPFTQWSQMQTLAKSLRLDETSVAALLTPPSLNDLKAAEKALEGVTRPPSILDAVADSPVISNFAQALSKFGLQEDVVKTYGSLGLLSLLTLTQQNQQQQTQQHLQQQKETFVQELLTSLPDTHQKAVRIVVQKHLRGDPKAVHELKQVILHGLQEKAKRQGKIPINALPTIPQAPILAPQSINRPAPLLNDPKSARLTPDRLQNRQNSDRPQNRQNSDRLQNRQISDRPQNRQNSDRPQNRQTQDRPQNRQIQDRPQSRQIQDRPQNPRLYSKQPKHTGPKPLPKAHITRSPPRAKPLPDGFIPHSSREITSRREQNNPGPDSSRFKYLSSKPNLPKNYINVDKKLKYATRRERVAAERGYTS